MIHKLLVRDEAFARNKLDLPGPAHLAKPRFGIVIVLQKHVFKVFRDVRFKLFVSEFFEFVRRHVDDFGLALRELVLVGR